jgi:penicillin-insensitive murein DD-endopeptidase
MRSQHRIAATIAIALAALVTDSARAEPGKPHGAAVAARSKGDHAGKPKPGAAPEKDKDAGKPKEGAGEAKAKPPASKKHHGKGGQSIGAPNDGKLAGAIRLRGSRVLRQPDGARSWGLPTLVRLVQSAAAKVARKHKGSVMLVGDLSGRTGGPIDGREGHQSGREVDIAFYVTNSHGKAVNVRHFVAMDGSGKGRELTWATFDEARNWLVVEALVSAEKADVQHIYVSSALKARLLAYASRGHATKDVIARASSLLTRAGEGESRDDHFHVRIACPEPREACIQEPVGRRGSSKARGGEEDMAAHEGRDDAASSVPAKASMPAKASVPDAEPAPSEQGEKAAP